MTRGNWEQPVSPAITHDNAWIAWALLDAHYQAEIANSHNWEIIIWQEQKHTNVLPDIPRVPPISDAENNC